ncbi:MAG: DMT family transporter [Oceanospirillaceae bacterium]|nr:DMT family transporter [Oceanospirillaceae bacterium]
MQTGMYIIFALLIGVISSIYMPMNAAVAKHLGSSLTASISFYFVAFITAVVLFALFGEHETIYKFKSVPPYLYLTGVVSAFIVFSITFLIPIIGVRKLTTLTIAGSILTAMIVSHFGMLASPVDPITFKKVAGATLLFIGAVISVT